MSIPSCLGFVSQKKGFVSAKDKPYVQLSNILMDGFRGGRIHISNSDYEEFLRLYTNDIMHNRRLCVIECKTGIFKFHMDADLETEQALTDPQKHELLKKINDAIKPFFKSPREKRFISIVSCAPPKIKDGFIKTGIHIVWPNINVSAHEALLLRENILSELNIHYSENFTRTGWENAIDASVYIGSGLRMIGSIKVAACTECNRRTMEYCGKCAGTGKLDEDRPYTFFCAYGDNSEIDQESTETLSKCLYKVVCLSSIRTFSEQICPEFERFQGAPSYVQPTFHDPTKPPKMPLSKEFTEDKRASAHWKRCRTSISDPAIKKVCERLVRNRINKQRYEKLYVKDITTDSTRSFYDVKVGGQGSNFCQNKMDDHSSNTIYFHIDKSGISQRCFCRKPIIRMDNTTCSKYKSSVKEISQDDKIVLFPPSKDVRFGVKHSSLHIQEIQKSLGLDKDNSDIATKIKNALNDETINMDVVADEHNAFMCDFVDDS